MRIRRAALAVLAVGLLVPAAARAAVPARVQGRFAMRALVTRAVGVPGEHRGERLKRTWWIRPRHCVHDVCRTLSVHRTLSGARGENLTLRRLRDGTYLGRGRFAVALACRGRVYRHGSEARVAIRLRVTATETIGGVRFAQRVAARYANTSRTDETPCSIGLSRDAARYAGRLRGGTPAPPHARFAARVSAGGTVDFADLSRDGSGPGRRIVAWRWRFHDPRAGRANRSARRAPDHTFTAPGRYRVSLAVTDAAGLTSRVTETIRIPGAMASGRRRRSAASRAARRAARRAPPAAGDRA